MRIILIGPPGVGKSTVAEILAERLDLPHAPMDLLRFGYYSDLGYDLRSQYRAYDRGGFPAVSSYWKAFQPYAMERILANYPVGIIDFGAGDSHFEDDALFARAEALLAPEPNVLLLLPSADKDETLKVIGGRLDRDENSDAWPVIASQVRHPSNSRLAKQTVYTGTRTPEEVADLVMETLGLTPPSA